MLVSAMVQPQAPDGYQAVAGPVRSVPTVRLREREDGGYDRWLEEGCVTVGNRVMAMWQDFGHMLGNGTVVGFERHTETSWVKVVIDYDYPNAWQVGDDGYVRWDWDRTILVHPAHWEGKTQDESVALLRERIAQRAEMSR